MIALNKMSYECGQTVEFNKLFSRIYKSDKIASINAMLFIFFKSIAGLHPWTKNAYQFPNSEQVSGR